MQITLMRVFVMKKISLLSIIPLLFFGTTAAIADSVDMRDYNLISNGMSEAEVLYRLGPYDHETVATGFFNNVLHKTWYYIPRQDEVSNRKWITEIRFDSNGRVTARERYRPR
jgi:hypothetical protein